MDQRWALVIVIVLLLACRAMAGPVIVLDPGHGGTNTGARDLHQLSSEKRVTLALARRIKCFLWQWAPQVRVVLTREQDEYLTLYERVQRANEASGTLFLSLHLNASPSHSQQGFETYLLDHETQGREATRLAFLEQPPAFSSRQAINHVPPRAPHATAATSPVIEHILTELRYSATHAESAQLGWALQQHLKQVRRPALDRGVKQASFDVLMGLRMPAVLVEVGFIDHPVEGPELLSPAVQEQLAIALSAALLEHLAQYPIN